VVVAECRERDGAARGELVRRINALGVDLLGTPPDDVVLAPPHAVLKTSSGKIRRAATREAYLAGSLGRAGRAPWRQILRLALSGGLKRLQRSADLLHGILAWVVFALLMPLAVAGILLLPGVGARWRCAALLVRLGIRLCGIRLDVRGRERLVAGPLCLRRQSRELPRCIRPAGGHCRSPCVSSPSRNLPRSP
jgi:hypothetical protein